MAQRKIKIFDHWISAKRYDKALDAGYEALASDPGNSYLHTRIGYLHYINNDHRKARSHLQTALAAEPENPYPRSLLALCNGDALLTRFSKVERQAFEALRLDPDHYNSWLILAQNTVD
jgi:tetratricopeptide (TPR) repeat protein